MYLTKTDFIHYLQCPKSLWLYKHKPKACPHKAFSDFLKKITREGYEVERYAQMLFSGGISIPPATDTSIKKTQEAITQKTKTVFQATVLTKDRLFARADILSMNDDGSHELYEVKASNSIKEDKKHNHLKDACFQKIAFERSGVHIDKVFIIHTDGEYVREVGIDPQKLLKKVDVTEKIKNMYDETEIEINNALSLLQEEYITENGCPCFRKTKTNHCDAFEYFNGALPKQSIWEIGNIREKKLCIMLDRGIQKIEDITEDIELNDKQKRQVRSVIEKRPQIDEEKIQSMLNETSFPLYFFDYEAAVNAVPKIVGTKPWQHIPFQFSLHILSEDDTLTHQEYLNENLSGTEKVVQAFCEMIGDAGSIVSWHASYEKKINTDLAKMYPQYAETLENANNRMFDLEDICKEAYTDAAFRGSTSIKKVLPVLCPNLSYKNLAVQDGTQAMEQWFAMIEEEDGAKQKKIKNALLEYCKLDTLAMVEIYKVIKNLIK